MKLTKTASGKQTLKISNKEWKNIGEKNGWLKSSQAIQRAVDEAVREHFKNLVPEDVKAQAEMANYDLWHGPVSAGEEIDGETYLGFTRAVDKIRDFADEIGDIYVDHMTGEISLSEPDAFGDWVHVNRSDILRSLFGRELVSYI